MEIEKIIRMLAVFIVVEMCIRDSPTLDVQILTVSREAAAAILTADRDLSLPEHRGLQELRRCLLYTSRRILRHGFDHAKALQRLGVDDRHRDVRTAAVFGRRIAFGMQYGEFARPPGEMLHQQFGEMCIRDSPTTTLN